MNGSVITTGPVGTLHKGTADEIRTVEVVTDGRVGSQADAVAVARGAFGAEPHLSFRKSHSGELRFYFTDRQV